MRVPAPAYIVPFMFIFEPSLLMIGEWQAILSSATTAIIGVVCLAGGLNGYFWRTTHVWERVVLVVSALLLIKPGIITDLAGLGLLCLVLLNQIVLSPAKAAAAPPAR